MKHAAATMLLLACVVAAAPQQTISPEIRGVVMEPGINLPIAGVEVALSVQDTGPVRINGGWKSDGRKTKTDERGLFTFALDKPGAYRVEVKKDGYLAAGIFGGPPEYAEVKLTAENPATDVKLFLARPGGLTGTVVHEDTGKPVANLRVRAVTKIRSGTFFPVDASVATTDAVGGFVIKGLSPGEYAVEIGSQTGQDQRVLKAFTDKDVRLVDVDYEHTYWPGGHGIDAVLTVQVTSGGTLDIGALRVKKGPYYRVHIRFPASNCEPGDKMSISEALVTSSILVHSLGQAPCGKGILVTGYSPGTYRLMFSTDGRSVENRGTASAPFSIFDKNIEIDAPLYGGVTVEGAVVTAGGSRLPDFASVQIFMHAVDGIGYPDEQSTATPDSQGKFQFAYVRLLDHQLLLRGLGPTHYLQQIRYNGRPVTGETVPLDSGAMTHSVTIVVADNPGMVLGTVMNGEQRAGNAFVIAVKWPLNKAMLRSTMAGAKSDSGGNFRLTGMSPGEYRLAAVGAGFVTSMLSNAEVERALAEHGTKVDVGAGEIQNVTLGVIELR